MRKNIITLTKEALALCATIKVREMELPSEIAGGTVIAGIEKTSVYGGSDLLEDVSMAIGCYELRDKDSDESPNGIVCSRASNSPFSLILYACVAFPNV